MRTTILLTLPLLLSSVARAADVYVAPDGNDANPGTLQKPFATIQRAQKSVNPGDTVFLRGGTYKMQENQIAKFQGMFAYITDLDKSGTPGKMINYFAYQNERPVFDCSAVKAEGHRIDAFYVSGSYLHFKGFEVTGVQVTIKTHTQSICFENDGGNNIYELLSMHDGQAIGIYSRGGANNLFLNCDAYRNWDYTSEEGRGGNVDGFGCHPRKGATNNVFRGCRSWYNSDDGFDCINSAEAVTFDHCWAMYNGLNAEGKNLGDGNGFKAGGYGATPVDKLPKPLPHHTVQFCLAVGNKNSGVYANHMIGGDNFINNTSYKNGVNFNFLSRLPDNKTDVDGYDDKIFNNLSYAGRTLVLHFDPAKVQAEDNSWQLDMHFTDADFLSVDEKELLAPRKPNGDLPDVKFLHLAPNNPAINKGKNVGFAFNGSAPDLGCFEK
ncbi:MAG TPA: DUF4990 domain-containing protein [Phycisphaerae bacterium]|nr:DUF4990 domain-containing protein [Phycisphaerae bacterium]